MFIHRKKEKREKSYLEASVNYEHEGSAFTDNLSFFIKFN